MGHSRICSMQHPYTFDVYFPPGLERLQGKGRVATLGMFIIDHFEVTDQHGNLVSTEDEALMWLIAMIAARQFLPSSHVGLLVDKGSDFPPRFTEDLERLGKDMIWFRHRDGPTTRALNIYSGRKIGEGHQSFKYISPQLQIFPRDLIVDPSPFAKPFAPEWIHVVCGSPRMKLIVEELEGLKRDAVNEGASHLRSQLVWEPLPFSCTPGESDNLIWLASRIAIFSPNLLELQSILGISPVSSPTHSNAEIAACAFLKLLTAEYPNVPAPAIVVRAGELGAFTLSPDWTGWVPAFWREEEQSQVVDVTGGGNSFLGGLLAGLLLSNGDIKAGDVFLPF
ncbi:hypothetical protein I350_06892 [Cryptococcus amylolentus CBS 6273]|uniref:Carbohydrate kinase PfkB domain-containing protein n=1 Tax=Cryptococcus amylolentus CBS 6273 TaxID=1296118 RepID=A0A1E3JHF1_9TREE|nr:hypothetical protein I350_06892 [Cryptococcus amylolentus CBS 6273]